MTARAVLLTLLATAASAQTVPLPLPEAPVRLVIADAAAFDAALTGAYRNALRGAPRPGDPVLAGFRQSQVGSKLEDQWLRLSKDLPWNWETLRKLRPRALGLAILDVGHLEAVLVVDTPLAVLPVPLPAGKPRTHAGVAYALVARGAADAGADPDRRLGLAWARLGDRLILATSERALKLTLDEAQAGRGLAAPLAGIVALDLDLDALRKDRYFKREFPFAAGPETGRVYAALRREAGQLVEVREGRGEPRAGGHQFPTPGAAAAGWEPDGQAFWASFRRGLLEPVPAPAELPVPAVAELPPARGQGGEDRYAINLTLAQAGPGVEAWEPGDLVPWQALLARNPIPGWGYWVTPEGVRRLVFPWPAAQDAAFRDLARATVARRAGRATVTSNRTGWEIQVGPNLPALAGRRTGGFLWVAAAARDLADLPTPQPDPALIRWARADLRAVRAEGRRWAKVEGPARPEQVRPWSDRVLGLLGWIPATESLTLERRRTATGWSEKLVIGPGAK